MIVRARRFPPLLLCALVLGPGATSLRAQDWTETGDAPTFPGRSSQVTRGLGELQQISGTTGAADLRDAYCVKVVGGSTFRATTDPASHAAASASFDTRLFLFDRYGRAVLANDDTPGGASTASTLNGAATDGSGFTLDQNGEYALVVTGASATPEDASSLDQFDFSAGSELIHAADPLAGRFDHWGGTSPATGAYTIGLVGAAFCEEAADALWTKSGEAHRTCRANGEGSYAFCEAAPGGSYTTNDGTLAHMGGDAHLDAVFANGDFERNRTCSGGRQGLIACVDVLTSSLTSYAVAVGDIDGDRIADAVFGNSGPNKVCFGDGGGLFTSCGDFFDPMAPNLDSQDLALGYLDGDAHLDVVVANDGAANRVCLGDGSGGIAGCTEVSTDVAATRSVALGLVDGDQHLDAIFANAGSAGRLCLGDGLGGFVTPCTDVDTGGATQAVALGLVDADAHLDVVFANASTQANRVCLGDGLGGFTCSNVSADTDTSWDVALGFLDEDEDLDAVFAGDVDSLCLGDGAGGFSCSDLATGGSGADSTSVTLGSLYEHPFFEDGFETGDTSGWTAAVP